MGRRWPARCGTVALVAIADAHVDQRQVRAAVRRPHAPRRRPAGRSLGSTLVTAAAARDACRRRRTAADAAAYSKQAALARQAHARLGGSTCARNAAVARRLRRGLLTTPAAQARLACVPTRAVRSHQRFARRRRARPHAGCMRRCARPPLRRTPRTTERPKSPDQTRRSRPAQPCSVSSASRAITSALPSRCRWFYKPVEPENAPWRVFGRADRDRAENAFHANSRARAQHPRL